MYQLNKDNGLKGYGFEYIARILLRRFKNNNFIFLTNRFDSIDEILIKYRLKVPPKFKDFINFARIEWKRTDIIEFELNNKKDRLIQNINIFDIKTKNFYVERDYFEMCISNDKFFKKCLELKIPSFIMSITLFNNWKFNFDIIKYSEAKIRTYSNYKSFKNTNILKKST